MVFKQILGTWNLIHGGFKYRYSNEEVLYPFGQEAKGLLIYTSNNYMSAQIMRPDRPIFASDVISKANSMEMNEAFQGYISYFGTFQLLEQRGVVVHRVLGSYFPNWIGRDLERYYTFSENLLTLTTMPSKTANRQMIAQLTWKQAV
jgi:hypothetical protein